MSAVEQVAAAVLYEGYILWPYCRSARKNQQRWTFGGVYPPAWSDATDPCRMQTQCLVLGDAPRVDVRVRFLQVVERRVGRRRADGSLEQVDELRVGGERYLAWDEAREREVAASGLHLAGLLHRQPIDIPAGEEQEDLGPGALVRRWRALQGGVEIRAERFRPDLHRLTVAIDNTIADGGRDRAEAARHTFVATHTLLVAHDGEFVSLIDPPADLKPFADACDNVKTWPVLAGEAGRRDTLLSSPIILYDYPQVAPESPGEVFDAAEIHQLLSLNILTLTDQEKDEMRATDPRARAILERTEALTADDFLALHGAIRELRPLRDADLDQLERPVPASVGIEGVQVGPGSRVRLRPRPGRDILDLALAGKIAVVESIEQDYDERVHLAVSVEDDPGRELGQARLVGHRFFFAPDEVEPLP